MSRPRPAPATGQAPATVLEHLGRTARLLWTMLRYRIAVMLWMFLLLGAAARDGLASLDARFGWAAIALGASYAAATSANDIADRDIDRVNHPGDPGRPLVTGAATVRDLAVVHAVAVVLALGAALAAGPAAVALIATSLAIGWAYSLGPVRLSYRTYLAPLVLAVAYVLLPYTLGAALASQPPAGSAPLADPVLLAAALYALFVARINLKDFRDRAGDALHGRPTLLLRAGKTATCAVSLGALVAGDALLLAALAPPPAIALVLQAFVAAIMLLLADLWRAGDPRAEQVAIGIGARLGNGLLLTALGLLVLRGQGAPPGERLLFAVAAAGLFAANAVALRTRPEEAVIGYKG